LENEAVSAAESPISAWARLLEASGRLVVRLIWLAVLVVVLATFGKCALQRSHAPERAALPEAKPVVRPVDWTAVDAAVVEALKEAHASAHSYAAERLDGWTEGLMKRVDDDFLDWYFSYLNQQRMGLVGLYQSVVHWIDADALTAEQRLREDIEAEFTRRVLRPEIAQLELERLTQDVVDRYVREVQRSLSTVPDRYRIPRPDWERYLEDTAAISSGVEGNRRVDLTLKTLALGSAAGGAVAVGKSLQMATAKLGSKVSGQAASSMAAGLAAETGAKSAAKLGGKALGPLIGVGVLAWDAWDHYTTREEYLPVLRRNLQDYLKEAEASLLDDPQTGVMAVVSRLESNIVESLSGRRRAPRA
jgi:hypothetical protein